MSWKSCLPLGALSVLLGLASLPASAGDHQQPADNYANDPRSSAAINLEIAKRKLKTFSPAIYGPPSRTIGENTVNNPLLDSTNHDTQSETSVAFLGSGKLVAAFNDSGSYSAPHFTGYAYSSDGGNTWSDGFTLPASAPGDAGDPVLAVDQTTHAVYMVTLGFSLGNTLPVFKSTNSGHSWSAPANGTPGFVGTDFQDKPWMTVDNFTGTGRGNVYLCWTRFVGPESIFFTRSTDGGATFGPSGGTLVSTGGQGCFVTVSPNHQVSVFYYKGTGAGGQGGDNKIFMKRSSDRGVTFGAEIQVADLNTTSINGNLALNGGVRSNSFPHAAVNADPLHPYIYVVYNDDPSLVDLTDNGNVYMVRSTNGGSTWSAPVTVGGAPRDQFFPTIGFASPGNLMVGFYSRADDPNNLWFHRRARTGRLDSVGAVTFIPSFQLSPNTPTVIGQDPIINSTYMGDYDQIVGSPGAFFSTWADNRNGDAFFAHQPDVRFARIASPPATADLALTATATTTTIESLDSTFVKLHVASASGTSRDVFVKMRADAGLRMESVSGGDCKLDGPFMGCSIGPIDAGVSKDVFVAVRGGYPAGIRNLTAFASTSSRDTAQGNNAATKAITVTASTAVTGSYSTGNIATAILDLNTINVPLVVADTGQILNVIPKFRLNHTFDSDLDIFLVSPAGKLVELSTDNGGSGDNYGSGNNDCTGTPTIFDDAAATSIVGQPAPFAGTFKPEGQLSNLLSDSAAGTWKLRITDDFGADVGTVYCFSMDIVRKP